MVSEIRRDYRLRDVIESLDYNELSRMKQDIEQGGFHLKQFIKKEIDARKHEQQTHCTTCASSLNPKSTHNFTLLFGPEDFRKKASFCGIDCLETFMSELKAIKKVV